MRACRVFPYSAAALAADPGGALFLPPGGGGRVDNQDLYRAFYVSSHAEGCVAEVFGRVPVWDPTLFVHPNGLPYALATYEIDDDSRLFALDNAEHLLRLGLKPSDVVRRDLERSQRWARDIYEAHEWDGISWWSFYGPQWQNIAIWHMERVALVGQPSILNVESDAVRRSANAIVRLIQE